MAGRAKTVSARQRLLGVVLAGCLVGGIAAAFGPWQFSVLAGWDVSAAAYIASVWLSIRHCNPEETRELATREDNSRISVSVLLISASVSSLIGTGLDLVKRNEAHGSGRIALTVIGILTVALSWAVVHTVFALRYAHEYYTPPIGGIDFKSHGDPPDFQDFAYVAFTVGMTFQVSDTDVQARAIRRTALRHALLSYLFGAVILAVTVNLIANLVK